jgi:predicted dehydrogenase
VVDQLGIGMIGSKFMGRAHANAWAAAPRFFDLPSAPVRRVIAARDPDDLARSAARWGWQRWTTDWHELVADPDVDLVDVTTPNDLHAEQAIAALEAGKHVACEKPLAGTLADARRMAAAAAASSAQTFVWYSYRRVPALGLARRYIAAGRLGRLYHVRAAYLQGWGGPDTPLVWRFDAARAGSGALGDLAAHIVDLARFLTGEEIVEVSGAIERRFIEERPLPEDPTRSGSSTVDDAVLFIGHMSGGAVASFEATRLATGVKNSNRIELHGELGAIAFDFQHMNELRVFDGTATGAEQGWTTIQTTHEEHPWMRAWWPDGHGLGYEHTFVNQAADIVRMLGGEEPEAPMPDFADAFVTQRVLEAAVRSARERRPVAVEEVQ